MVIDALTPLRVNISTAFEWPTEMMIAMGIYLKMEEYLNKLTSKAKVDEHCWCVAWLGSLATCNNLFLDRLK